MSITGYIDPTKRPEAMLKLDSEEVRQVIELTSGNQLTLMAGLVEANPSGKPFITQIVAREGKLLGYYRKVTIVDDEVAWFSPGGEVPVFDPPLARFGVAICADINNPEVFAAGAKSGARIIFEAAAPGLYGSQQGRNWESGFNWWKGECMTKLSKYAREDQVYIAVATQAGRTLDEDFPGGGYVFAPDGSCLAATPDWEEGTLYAEISLQPGHNVILRDESGLAGE
jgi:predicted amidohydrolase